MKYNELPLIAAGTTFSGKLTPSKIIPGTELIRNAERALSGKLHVDITATKRKLQIVFDILDNTNFEQILDVFKVENADCIDPDGILVEYYDLRDNADSDKHEH